MCYRAEAARGEDGSDDQFQPGFFELTLHSKEEKDFAVNAAVDVDSRVAREILDSIGKTIGEVAVSFTRESARRSEYAAEFYGLHPEVSAADWLSWVLSAADSFIVQSRSDGKAVIAGYHWFESWGRDTFISLPGLLLVTRRFSEARDILRTYNRFCRGGLIPNFVSDKTGEAAYNTVDGTLWCVNAVLQYLKYTRDYAFVEAELWDNLQTIISSHEQGMSLASVWIATVCCRMAQGSHGWMPKSTALR